MCPVWCLRRRLLIDSDIECNCPDEIRLAHQEKSCLDCLHYGAREGKGPMCRLTHEPLPPEGNCCHWGIGVSAITEVRVSVTRLAPGLLRYYMVSNLWQLLEEANLPYVRNGDVATIPLDALALPLTYGVPTTNCDR